MPVERYFLGWDAPVTAKVREFLLPQQLCWQVDMGWANFIDLEIVRGSVAV